MSIKYNRIKLPKITPNKNYDFKKLKNLNNKFSLNYLLNVKKNSKQVKRYKEDKAGLINYFSNENNVVKRNLKLYSNNKKVEYQKINNNKKKLILRNKSYLNQNLNYNKFKIKKTIKDKIIYLQSEKLKINELINNYLLFKLDE